MDTVAALGRDVNDEETAELALTALAVAAYVIGQSTGASTVSPGLPDCPPNQDPAGLETRCRLTTLVPSTGNGEGGPIDQRVDAVHSDAYDRIVAINQASNALDEFVTLHPRSADWDDAEYAEFTGLRDALAATCER